MHCLSTRSARHIFQKQARVGEQFGEQLSPNTSFGPEKRGRRAAISPLFRATGAGTFPLVKPLLGDANVDFSEMPAPRLLAAPGVPPRKFLLFTISKY